MLELTIHDEDIRARCDRCGNLTATRKVVVRALGSDGADLDGTYQFCHPCLASLPTKSVSAN